MWKTQTTFTIFNEDGSVLSKDVEVSSETFGIFAKVWEDVAFRGHEIFKDVRDYIDPLAEMIGGQDTIKIKYHLENDQIGEVKVQYFEIK